MKNDENEIMEQYDYTFDDYLYKVIDKYAPLIGQFLVVFSELEHELNITIAEILHHGTHYFGYVVIEKLTTLNKIELFYKFYLSFIRSADSTKLKIDLESIESELRLLNTFRNRLVHANWISLNKHGSVRTKISIDNQDGEVVFKRVKLLPKDIRKNIKSVERLTTKLENFREKCQEL